MTEVWNPFDDGNPVYKELAKQTAINRKTWRVIGTIAVAMVVADAMKPDAYTRRVLRKYTGIGAYNNPYGIIRR